MLMVIVQEIFFYLLIKSLIRELSSISLFDAIFLLVVFGSTYTLSQFLNVYLLSLLVLFVFILFSWWYLRNLEQAASITLQVFIWSVVMDHLSNLAIQMVHIPNGYIAIFVTLQSVSVIVLNLILERTEFEPTFERNSLNRVIAFLLFIIYAYIIFSEGWNNQFRMIFSNLVVLLVLVSLCLMIYSEYLKNVKIKYEIQQKDMQIKNDTRYVTEIETHYNELRRFRHDYQNMMLSITEYLKTSDLKGLQQYYSENIEPVTKRVFTEQYNLEDLSRIKVKSIKSILFSKLNHAQSEGIKVDFKLKEPLTEVSTNELDLDIALGVILDNAIEASIGHNRGEIMGAIFLEKDSTVFLIQNNVFEQLPPLWQLKKEGYSTKGEGRGIGLSSLSKIVNRNDNMILETRVLDSVFLQRLTVKRVSQND